MTQKTALPRQFGKIILTLENCLLSDNKIQETPSQHDGLNKDVEMDLRILGCELIQIAGILLKLPQVSCFNFNCAAIFALLQFNFYRFKSFNCIFFPSFRLQWQLGKCCSNGFITQNHICDTIWKQLQ